MTLLTINIFFSLSAAGSVHQRTPPKSCFAIRYLMAVLGSIGLAIIYGFKVNVSIAIVAMVNHTGLKGPENLTSINETVNFNVTSKSKEVNITTKCNINTPSYKYKYTYFVFLLLLYYIFKSRACYTHVFYKYVESQFI